MLTLPTFTGDLAADDLGLTLIHEHIFVGDPELEVALPHPEWDELEAIERAVAGLDRLADRGVSTVVDLTVPGLGRRVDRVAHVAERTRVNIVAATGYYTASTLPHEFRLQGPGRLRGGPDALTELFLRDIRDGIAGTLVRAGMLKVVSDDEGITPDVEHVFRSAADAHRETGTPITTHSHAQSRGGIEQQRLLASAGVALDRVVIGHSCDTTDLGYLREIADAGSFLGFDRFGMIHMASDDERVHTLLELLSLGYEDRIVLSHDAAFFSRVTPPSWRAAHTPNWQMEYLFTGILPRLRASGISEESITRMMVDNPRRVLCGAESIDSRETRN